MERDLILLVLMISLSGPVRLQPPVFGFYRQGLHFKLVSLILRAIFEPQKYKVLQIRKLFFPPGSTCQTCFAACKNFRHPDQILNPRNASKFRKSKKFFCDHPTVEASHQASESVPAPASRSVPIPLTSIVNGAGRDNLMPPKGQGSESVVYRTDPNVSGIDGMARRGRKSTPER